MGVIKITETALAVVIKKHYRGCHLRMWLRLQRCYTAHHFYTFPDFYASALMERSMKSKLLFTLCVVTAIASCQRYAVTLNNQPVYSPAPLYKGYKIADEGLAACVKQAIADQKVTEQTALSTLSCTFAGVKDLSGIAVFSKLRSINLSNNQLASIQPLLFMAELSTVNLNENPNVVCEDVASLETLLPSALIEANACSQ